jgi:transposase
MPSLYSEREKKRLRIQQLLELGWSMRAICQKEKCTLSMVAKWKRRFELKESASDRQRSGRPPKLTPTQRESICAGVKGKIGESTRKTAKRLKAKKIEVSRWTIARILTKGGLRPRHRPRQQLLTQQHKARRVTFAKKHRDSNWDIMLMTDETAHLFLEEILAMTWFGCIIEMKFLRCSKSHTRNL